MLVMTHNTGDVIHIGDDIQIQIIYSRDGRVKLGYTAPENVRILRDKVKDRIEREGSRDERFQDD